MEHSRGYFVIHFTSVDKWKLEWKVYRIILNILQVVCSKCIAYWTLWQKVGINALKWDPLICSRRSLQNIFINYTTKSTGKNPWVLHIEIVRLFTELYKTSILNYNQDGTRLIACYAQWSKYFKKGKRSVLIHILIQ